MRPQPAIALTRKDCEALAVGIEAVRLLRAHFPAFYAQHAAALPAVPERLLGAVAALLQLVEETYRLPLSWPEDDMGEELDHCEDPAETLVMYDGVSVEFMAELGRHVYQMLPAYYGIGVQLLLEDGYSTADPLRLALYQLFQHTQLSIGVDIPMLLEEAHGLPAAVAEAIGMLHPLPRDVGTRELCALVARDLPEAADLPDPGRLVRYAFGETGNPLADTNEHEQIEVFGVHPDGWDWSQLAQVAAWSQEAQQLDLAFGRWHRRVVDAGPAGVELLGELVHRHARTLRRRDKRQARSSRALIDTLGAALEEETHDDDDTPGAALAARAAAAPAA